MTGGHSRMTQDEESQTNPKIEVQYSDEGSFIVDKVLLEFDRENRMLLIEYDYTSQRMIAHFLKSNPNVDENIHESEYWVLEKEDFQSKNMRFKFVIGQSMWRFQRIKKQIQVTEIRGIIRKIITDEIVYEYAAPLAQLSRIEIFNGKTD
jgi:hypothetical protein